MGRLPAQYWASSRFTHALFTQSAKQDRQIFKERGVAWLPLCRASHGLSTPCAKKVFRFCFYMCARIILFLFFFVNPLAGCGVVATLSRHPPARYHFFTTLSRQHCDTRRTARQGIKSNKKGPNRLYWVWPFFYHFSPYCLRLRNAFRLLRNAFR